MDTLEQRLDRVEAAILALADLRDPANHQFPLGGGERSRVMNNAEQTLARLANEIRQRR